MPSPIDTLLAAIRYPDAPRAEGDARVILVDDCDVRLEECNGGQLRFTRTLHAFDGAEDPGKTADILARMASFAAGRLLKEEAVLAWDDARHTLVLWQESEGSTADAASLRRSLNLFLASCDWWSDRLQTESHSTIASLDGGSPFPEMLIRP